MFGRQTGFVAIVVVLAACAADKPEPTGVEVRTPLFAVGGNSGGNSDNNLGTHLTGDEEVPPRVTPAQGQAIFRVRDDGDVDYRLIASNIDNVFMAHIHCGARGTNGPVVIWLYQEDGTPAPPAGGPQNGVLASGTFTPTGVCAGKPLLQAMRDGDTYVNVHTSDGVAPGNTGPGDFPGGEIRGQLGDKNN